MIVKYKNEKFKDEYKRKLLSLEDAAKLVNSGDLLIGSMCETEATTLTDEVGKRSLAGEITGVEYNCMGPHRTVDWITAENKKNMWLNVSFVINAEARKAVNDGVGEYTPMHAFDKPDIIINYKIKGRKPGTTKVLLGVSPMDEWGYFSTGSAPGYTLEPAREENTTVVAQVNEHLPYVYGDNFIHISEIDHVVEDSFELLEPGLAPTTDLDIAIAEQVSGLVEDGATIQLGLGSMPNVLGQMLADKTDLGAHSEQVGDAFMALWEAGALTGNCKTVKPRKITGCFSFGSRKMYDWIDHNPAVEMYSQKWTNDPFVIAQNYKFTGINQALEIDFTGQISAESMGFKQYSGTGGQPAFVEGARRSPGGKSIICLRSTAKGGTVSNIVPFLRPGTAVTTSRNDTQYVVTEHGTAQLEGKTIPERAKALIDIAHPDFREELRREAEKIKYL
ncbi:MAG: 4-hydroxybutyrate CoA-transferase [Clostridiales Family XIII bacterium]|jgi:acyl-CoA hydrolase|nr:4-hydroxybutyrate CoA-transferase [Clostridiales Family XIII bacterium]